MYITLTVSQVEQHHS